jgi:transposase InsO family protein
LVLVQPQTVIAWHRRAFRLFWLRKSLAGRPTTRAEIRRLIRDMAQENRTWGAPRIHGELLRLGYVLGERTVSRYMARIRPEPTKPRSQTWATFLMNHTRDIVAVDMSVVPTIRFQVLYIFIILGLERRRLVFTNVTTNPTAQWLAQQVVNAFPWDSAPRFLIRDPDRAYGLAFSVRVRGLGIREIRTAARAPLMNAFAERAIGTLRRECFDHLDRPQ